MSINTHNQSTNSQRSPGSSSQSHYYTKPGREEGERSEKVNSALKSLPERESYKKRSSEKDRERERERERESGEEKE